MSLTIYSYPENSRANKALIAAQYAGVKIDLAAGFKMGETNKTADFLAKFPLGKVPSLETPEGGLFESNSIARYVARQNTDKHQLYGRNAFEASLIDAWLDMSINEIDLPASAWLFPIWGLMPNHAEATKKAKGDIRKVLELLNKHLTTRTFLVGERLSLADIVLSMSLFNLYKLVLDPGFRKVFVAANRWFSTCINQPQFKAVIGDAFKFCEKMAVAPEPEPAAAATGSAPATASTAAPKEAKPAAAAAPKKEKKETADEDDDGVPKEAAKKNPLDDLPKSPFDLDAWKRHYSNNSGDIRGTVVKYFWENFDREGWSIWFGAKNDNSDYAQMWLLNNAIGGWIQRLDGMRKYGFGSVVIFGDVPAAKVGCAFLFRGQDIPQEMKDSGDYDSYEWRKADPNSETDKALWNNYLAWSGDFGEGRVAADGHENGRIYK